MQMAVRRSEAVGAISQGVRVDTAAQLAASGSRCPQSTAQDRRSGGLWAVHDCGNGQLLLGKSQPTQCWLVRG